MKQSFADQIKAARSANTPLLAIETADNNAAIQRIAAALSDKTPLIQWDVVRGWTSVETVIEGVWVENQAGVAAMATCRASGKDLMNPVASLEEALNLPGKLANPFQPGSVLFIHNGHEYLKDPDFAQALFNLRDKYKSNMRTIILLGPAFTLPAQLAQHVTVLDDPLPTTEELATVLKSFGVAGLKLTEDEERRAVEALLGLGTFAAEQSVATSLHVNGSVTLDFDRLWARKRKMIKSTPGLEVWEGGETFGDIGGCDQIKKFARAILNGKRRPECVVFLDEVEKAMAGSGGGGGQDTSGVSQGMLGKMLSEMQDNEYTGMVFVGVPGAAKSAIAKAMGAEGNIPVIVFDLGGMKDSLVGASEARLATALKVVKAVSNGNAMFIATSNNISNLPPELLRRFSLGTFFFDLPSANEREAIWKIYKAKYNLPEGDAEVARDDNWTGAEIKNCCDIASRTDLSLLEAAEFIVPVAVSGAEKIRQLRAQAAGRYLSAAKPGAYQFDEATMPERLATPVSAGRMIEKEV